MYLATESCMNLYHSDDSSGVRMAAVNFNALPNQADVPEEHKLGTWGVTWRTTSTFRATG